MSEWALDEEGIKKMHDMIKNGKFVNIDKIFSSTEEKARITSEAISREHGIPIVYSEEIVEVDRGRSGFIEGDYEKIVERYLSESEDFEYQWEDISHVMERALKFLKRLESETGNILVISHGMFLSILLSRYYDMDIFTFWKGLTFGQMLKVDFKKLKSSLCTRT